MTSTYNDDLDEALALSTADTTKVKAGMAFGRNATREAKTVARAGASNDKPTAGASIPTAKPLVTPMAAGKVNQPSSEQQVVPAEQVTTANNPEESTLPSGEGALGAETGREAEAQMKTDLRVAASPVMSPMPARNASNSRRSARRGEGSATGKLVTLRPSEALFERLEGKALEHDVSPGKLIVALLQAAVTDPALLSPISRPETSGKSGRDLALALLRKPRSSGFSRQVTVRVPKDTYQRAATAAKMAGEKELAPYLVVLVERQLMAL